MFRQRVGRCVYRFVDCDSGEGGHGVQGSGLLATINVTCEIFTNAMRKF